MKKCSVPGCDPKNHDLCLCGHDRMDHDPDGVCWGSTVETGCYPGCQSFTPATREEFEAFREEFLRKERAG